MDGQDFNNEQNNTQPAQENGFYQDNTTNPYSEATTNYANYAAPVEPEKTTDTLAVVSLVLGILGIVASCCYGAGILFAIGGLICAIIAQKRNKSGIGTAGLVCSIIGIVFSVIVLVFFGAVIAEVISDPEMYSEIYRNYNY